MIRLKSQTVYLSLSILKLGVNLNLNINLRKTDNFSVLNKTWYFYKNRKKKLKRKNVKFFQKNQFDIYDDA